MTEQQFKAQAANKVAGIANRLLLALRPKDEETETDYNNLIAELREVSISTDKMADILIMQDGERLEKFNPNENFYK